MAMNFEYGAPIIDFWGPIIRVGLEGKWVEFVVNPDYPKNPPRKEILALIHEMDKGRTH